MPFLTGASKGFKALSVLALQTVTAGSVNRK